MSWLPDELSVIRLKDGRKGTFISGRPNGHGTVELKDGEIISITQWDIAEVLYEPDPEVLAAVRKILRDHVETLRKLADE